MILIFTNKMKYIKLQNGFIFLPRKWYEYLPTKWYEYLPKKWYIYLPTKWYMSVPTNGIYINYTKYIFQIDF